MADDCIEWTGARDRRGYGRMRYQGRTVFVHRVEWMKHHGPPPEDKPLVLHRCDNPPCHNIDHLFVGTKTDNNRDMAAKGRNHQQRKGRCGTCGSPFEPERRKDGGRWCRPCERRRGREYRARRKAAGNPPLHPTRTVACACGCGGTFPENDGYGRPRIFLNGHNARKPTR